MQQSLTSHKTEINRLRRTRTCLQFYSAPVDYGDCYWTFK